MRYALYAVFIIVALWVGDMFYFHGRYTHEAWLEVGRLLQDLNYAVRRWTSF
jgi:hypothetical protein